MPDFPVSVRGRFKRSVDLVRDFYSDPALDAYIVTPTARNVLAQVASSLGGGHAERAWTLTGPYGSGKSAFALFVSHLMRGTPEAISHLREADAERADQFAPLQSAPFCPVLVGGSRRSLNAALLSGLVQSLEAFADAQAAGGDPISRLESLAEEAQAKEQPADDEVVRLFTESAEAVRDLTGGGLFIIVDELGKLLEQVALDPDQGDIFVLQQLAEHASRTAESDDAALFLVTILHQAFERYASHLDRAQREEWQKVQGRFEDIAYVESADTTLQLLAEAIEVEGEQAVAPYAAYPAQVVKAISLPKRFDEQETKTLLHRALPLHPTVGLMVGPLFRRLAQNERSLFAFLAAQEPGGFMDVLSSGYEASAEKQVPLYRLDHLYDYLLNTLGATLFSQSTSKLWAETEAALGRVREASELAEQLLKQIALLNFAGEMAGLLATTALLKASVEAPNERVEEELERLTDERAIVYRKYNDSYSVWQGSDLDLDEEVEKARENVSPDVPLADLLREVLPPSPVAAHRHSYDTGTTRVFDVQYASGDTWPEVLDEEAAGAADGYVIYVLPERDERRESLVESLEAKLDGQMILAAVPEGVGALRDSVYELRCLDWVSSNVDTLSGDAAARRELRERRADLKQRIDSRLNRLLVSDEHGNNPCQWVHQGRSFQLEGRRTLQNKLSEACDETYPNAPEIWNELLNVRQPSPSAVRGQKKLLEAMVLGNAESERDPAKERLGIDGTPAEYGLYASIVQATGMHREGEEGQWHFSPPYEDAKPGCYAVWQAISDKFASADGRRVSLDTFFEQLSHPPYGVRSGLVPVFLFAYFKANEDEIAVYENGTFLQEINYGTIERLLKSPAKFDMQQVTIRGTRDDVLRKLAPLVGLPEEERKPLPFVLRLLQKVRGLPPYVRKTSRMSEEAMAVREALYRTSDPASLLFEALPQACDVGIDSFLNEEEVEEKHINAFVQKLQSALREITQAYDMLIREVQRRVATAFSLRSDSVEKQRHELAERAQRLEPHVSDADVKSFVIRATNEVMDTQAWYESIATLLADRPPVKWLDDDLESFGTALRQVARKFKKREPLIFEDKGDASNGEEAEDRAEMRLHRIRLGITALGEPEQETVVNIHPEDEEFVEEMSRRLQETLEDEPSSTRSTEVKLAALGRLMQRMVNDEEAELDVEL